MRANDKGDLVVTKGDQYDVRENTEENEVLAYACLEYFSVISFWFWSGILVCLRGATRVFSDETMQRSFSFPVFSLLDISNI